MAMEILRPLIRDHRGVINRFAPVEERHDRILVIASGPSGAGPWPEHPGVTVIAVNGTIDGFQWDPEYWFTLDPSPVNFERLSNQRAGTKYFVGVDGDYGPDAHLMKYRQDFTGCHLLWVKREEIVSNDTRKITVGNSGRAAIHLAMHMGAKRIGVLGVDGTDEAHWHNPQGRSGSLKALGKNLDVLRRDGVEFLFGTTGTNTVVGHPKAAPQKVLDWLRE